MPPSIDADRFSSSSDTLKNARDKMHLDEIILRRLPPGEDDLPLSLGERIKQGGSLLQWSNLLQPDEIHFLKQAALETAETSPYLESESAGDGQGDRGHLCVRMPIWAAAERDHSLADVHLSVDVSNVLEQILERAYHYMDTELCSSVRETLFGGANWKENNDNEKKETNAVEGTANNGGCESSEEGAAEFRTDTTTDHSRVSMVELFRNQQLDFSIREPAMNVYRAPFGHFGMHKDGKALTILVPLSDPTVEFEGGGTAFWKERFPKQGTHGPSLILKPDPGSVLLFGGTVSHSGMHIRQGQRVVFVASFSRRSNSTQHEDAPCCLGRM